MALIHRWPLTANAIDIVGGLETTNNGSVTFDATNGASFNGSNQWLNCTKLIPGICSMSIWIKPKVYGSFPGIFGAATSDLDYVRGIYISVKSLLYQADRNIILTVENEFTSTNYPSTAFTLICMTNNTLISGYRNTTLVGSRSSSTGGYYTNSLSIGRLGAYTGSQYYFNGNMLDARIYDHVLSTDEIAALVSAGPNGGTSKYFPQAN